MDPSPDPGARPPGAAAWRGARAAIAALRAGQFDATLTYRDGHSLVLRVCFDLGTAGIAPRLHTLALIREAGSIRLAGESIVVGARAWRRAPTGRWACSAPDGPGPTPGGGVRRVVHALLPMLDGPIAPAIERRAGLTTLRWRDDNVNADIVLELDPAGDIPRRFRRETNSTGTVLLVTYTGWNAPVTIAPLADSRAGVCPDHPFRV